MSFQEFPKCLFLHGDVTAEYVIVKDSAHEAEKRAEGFRGAQEKADEPKRARARKESKQ
jgi:hypothetical protein